MAKEKRQDVQKRERTSRIKNAKFDVNLTRQAFLYLVNKEHEKFIDLLKTKQVDIDEIFLLSKDEKSKISITIREYVLLFHSNKELIFNALQNYALTMPIPYKMKQLFGNGKKKTSLEDEFESIDTESEPQ